MLKESVISLFISILFLNTAYAAEIDSRIAEKLLADGYASVIVYLDEDSRSAGIQGQKALEKKDAFELKKEHIRLQQDKFLSSIKHGPLERKGLKGEGTSIQADEKKDLWIKHRYSTVSGFSGLITRESFEKLKENPMISGIYMNGKKTILLDTSTGQINATRAWGITASGINITGRGQTVCVIDTGVNYNHTSLGSGWGVKAIGGYNTVGDSSNRSCSEDNSLCLDDYGHGTHVAGIIASNHSTYKGAAPDANIFVIKANVGSSFYDADIIDGIDLCVNNASMYNISVISMSLGGDTLYSGFCDNEPTEAAFSRPISAAAGMNISVVVATGNKGYSDRISSPACIENATPVGAVDGNDCIDCWSGSEYDGYDRAPNLVRLLMPGVTITSTYYSSNTATATFSGTSMATPHAAAAFALVRQFLKLYNGSMAGPDYIESILNSTGKAIIDGSATYRRINIYAALLSLDYSAPNVTFVMPTPANNTVTYNNSLIVNITSNKALYNAILDFNGTNWSMSGSGSNWYKQMTVQSNHNATYTYKVYGNDTLGVVGLSEPRLFTSNNTPAIVSQYSPSEPDFFIAEANFHYFLNISVYDPDNNTINITWYRNSTVVRRNSNYTFEINNSIKGFYNITLEVFDTNHTAVVQWNMTINHTCYTPFEKPNISENVTYCADEIYNVPGGISVSANNIVLNCNGSMLNGTNAGAGINISGANYTLIKNCTVAHYGYGLSIGNSFYATIGNTSLFNNSLYNLYSNQSANTSAEYNYWGFLMESDIANNMTGSLDFEPWCLDTDCASDSDADRDGYSNQTLGGTDCEDSNALIYPNATEARNGLDDNCNSIIDEGYTIGNSSNISSTTIWPNVSVSGNTDMSFRFNETQNVTVKDNGTIILEFKFNFSANPLNLSAIQIEKQNATDNFSYALVRGVLAQNSTTKTLYIDNLGMFNGVCIRDAEIQSINNITANCTGSNEHFVDCPGVRGQYNCTFNNNRWKIAGLNHSGARQANDTNPPAIQGYLPSSTASTSTAIQVTTDENCSCRYSSSAGFDYANMTSLFTGSGLIHDASVSTSSTATYRFYIRCNDTYGNYNNFDYIANVSAQISGSTDQSSPGGGSGGGGGGGGGSGASAGGGKAVFFFQSIPQNEEKQMKVNKQHIAFTNAYFTANSQLKSVTITIRTLENYTTRLKNIYQYIQIEKTGIESNEISSARIQFGVNNSWLKKHNYSRSTIKLWRLESREWKSYPTRQINYTANKTYYETVLPGFSDFAITAEQINSDLQDKLKFTEGSTQPGLNNTANATITQASNNLSSNAVQPRVPGNVFPRGLTITLAIVLFGTAAYFIYYFLVKRRKNHSHRHNRH